MLVITLYFNGTFNSYLIPAVLWRGPVLPHAHHPTRTPDKWIIAKRTDNEYPPKPAQQQVKNVLTEYISHV